MAHYVWFVTLAVAVAMTSASSLNERDLERALRTLESISNIKREVEEKQENTRHISEAFECREDGEACRSVPSCCGELVCYWPDGFSLLQDGVCVDCVRENRTCQRDSQCCSDLQCNKGHRFQVDGSCEPYRRTGPCYRTGQCVTACNRKWYQIEGYCT